MSGYPQDLLSNRSVVKSDFAIITPQGRVINTLKVVQNRHDTQVKMTF